ncbi:MAG TPA: hypothetical protein DDY20_11955 [Desulfobulbaceae bacterium]|nr:hypothetical protein [Desulfobulbaceae bacterium]
MALKKNKHAFLTRFAWLEENPRKRLLQGAALLLLLLAGVAHLKACFLAQLAMNNGAHLANFSRDLTDPDALAGLARKEHLANGNLSKALALYQRGLANFVLHVPSWLGIAEVFNDLGQKDKAAAALRSVHAFAANSGDTTWSKALLAHELDLEDILEESLSWLATHNPGKFAAIFALADLRWQDTTALLDHFEQGQYLNLLDHYIRLRETEKARVVWQGMEKAGVVSREIALKYVNFLLQRDEIEQAAIVWRKHWHEEDRLLYDGSFQEPPADSGFAWRITRAKGVAWQQLPGKEGLTITFDGTENSAFRLSQIVPLAPGDYLFTGSAKTSGLTTDQRPFWSINGYKCNGLAVKDSMLPPTIDRQELALPFTVPDSCLAVQLSLQRNTSYFFDNKIAGTMILKGLSIIPLSGPLSRLPQTTPPEKAAGLPSGKNIRIKTMKIH